MTKVVINMCYGGFGLSVRATEQYLERKGKKAYWFTCEYGEKHRRVGDPDDSRLLACYTTPGADEGSFFSDRDLTRDDPDLIAVVEELGAAADGRYAELEIVEIPDDVKWAIEEYDGIELVAEAHRTWP